ncbi:putative phage abortive infection protein [Leisingera aquaemixtae]|uniref:Phage abortive infection protein n=1 Tax=Leisingera aquaemixtae TaxID=1396826 RepID=A0ABY5WJI4_9RHOB|nr:putative phage abortive infection protein [Leisingera aquaemixtae]UWQ41621.1 putative phage abortive infection protein [Leisingera aquaemixtae]
MYERKHSSGWIISVVALFALALWVVNLLIGLYYSGQESIIGDRGTFGDVFGAANSLFTAFAFVGVIYSIAMQREELAITRSEMSQTKRLLAEQQQNLKNQNLSMSKQVFESTFFKMFDSFVSLTDAIDIQSEDNTPLRGKDAIDFLFKKLQKRYYDQKELSPDLVCENSASTFDQVYSHFFHDYGHEFSHYFRTLYTLLNFVEKSEVEDKAFYIKLVRAQLSDSEAALLLCNYLSHNTTKKFNSILEKYGMLKNVDRAHLIVKDNLDLVPLQAFGRTRLEH